MTEKTKKRINWFDIYFVGIVLAIGTLPLLEGDLIRYKEQREQRKIETQMRELRVEKGRQLDELYLESDLNHDGRLEGKEVDFYKEEIKLNGLNRLSFR